MSHRLASNKSAGSGGTASDFDETMPYNVDTALENVLPEPAPLPDLTPQRFADLKMLREKTLPLPGDMEVRVDITKNWLNVSNKFAVLAGLVLFISC